MYFFFILILCFGCNDQYDHKRPMFSLMFSIFDRGCCTTSAEITTARWKHFNGRKSRANVLFGFWVVLPQLTGTFVVILLLLLNVLFCMFYCFFLCVVSLFLQGHRASARRLQFVEQVGCDAGQRQSK